jgi:hypothetical protein
MNVPVIRGILLRQWWRTVSLLCGDRRYRRGLKLLKANLTPSQLNEFLTYRRFNVVGGVSGHVYRISLTGARNVEELDQEGRCIRRLCFFPEGELVAGDVVLAQKVALETFEAGALAIANKFLPSADHFCYSGLVSETRDQCLEYCHREHRADSSDHIEVSLPHPTRTSVN